MSFIDTNMFIFHDQSYKGEVKETYYKQYIIIDLTRGQTLFSRFLLFSERLLVAANNRDGNDTVEDRDLLPSADTYRICRRCEIYSAPYL